MHRIKVRLGDKIGLIPDNFIEMISKETPRLPVSPSLSNEKPISVSKSPSPVEKKEVHMCTHLFILCVEKLNCLHINITNS